MEYFVGIFFIFFAGFLAEIFGKMIKINQIPLYIISAIIIGPYGFCLAQNNQVVIFLSQLGTVFLMFSIGMELSKQKILAFKNQITSAILNILVPSIFIGLVLFFIIKDIFLSFLLGASFAVSSTAITVEILNERKKGFTKTNRNTMSTIITQDFLSVFLLLYTSFFITEKNITIMNLISKSFVETTFILTSLMFAGRRLLTQFYQKSLQNKKINGATTITILIIIGIGTITSYSGLSFETGAFLAGVLLTDTEFKYQIQSEILIFKKSLIFFFFMAIGLESNITFLVANISKILFFSIIFIVLKIFSIFFSSLLFFDWRTSLHSSILLVPFSEIAFVILHTLLEHGKISPSDYSLYSSIGIVTMIVTPVVEMIISKVVDEKEFFSEVKNYQDHVIIIGFGETTRILVDMLDKNHIQYIGVEKNIDRVKDLRDSGLKIFYGDGFNNGVLKALGGKKAKMILFGFRVSQNHLQNLIYLKKEFHCSMCVRAETEDIKNLYEENGFGVIFFSNYDNSLKIYDIILQEFNIKNLVK